MRVTAFDRAMLEVRESVCLEAYGDSKGIWTIGVGHPAACRSPVPGAGVKITAAEVNTAFARDLARLENSVSTGVRVPLADHELTL
jgi:lysozyme